MTTSPPRILHLEHDPSDAALVRETLEADGLGGQVTGVATEAEFVRALDQGGVDIVLADLALPFVDGLAALSVTRTKHPAVGRVAIARDVFVGYRPSGRPDRLLGQGRTRRRTRPGSQSRPRSGELCGSAAEGRLHDGGARRSWAAMWLAFIKG